MGIPWSLASSYLHDNLPQRKRQPAERNVPKLRWSILTFFNLFLLKFFFQFFLGRQHRTTMQAAQQHRPQQKKLCKYISQYGNCRFGDACHFFHPPAFQAKQLAATQGCAINRPFASKVNEICTKYYGKLYIYCLNIGPCSEEKHKHHRNCKSLLISFVPNSPRALAELSRLYISSPPFHSLLPSLPILFSELRYKGKRRMVLLFPCALSKGHSVEDASPFPFPCVEPRSGSNIDCHLLQRLDYQYDSATCRRALLQEKETRTAKGCNPSRNKKTQPETASHEEAEECTANRRIRL